MGEFCGVTPWGVNCQCTGELLVGIPWPLVLPSGCTGGCESVQAVGVPCSHGSVLPGGSFLALLCLMWFGCSCCR